VRRRLLVALVASVLLLSAACSSDDGGDGGDDGPAATNPPSLPPLNALEVHIDEPGETPRAPLVQSIADGGTWDGGIQFRLGVEALLAARAVGDTTLTITGEIPLFSTTVALEAQVQLLARRGDRYTLAATITMSPTEDTGVQLDLRGLGRLVGDLHQVGLRSGVIGLNGTAVVPDRGPTPQPMTLRVDVDQRHSDDAGTGTTS
jgi:hypothetical protein